MWDVLGQQEHRKTSRFNRIARDGDQGDQAARRLTVAGNENYARLSSTDNIYCKENNQGANLGDLNWQKRRLSIRHLFKGVIYLVMWKEEISYMEM